MLEVLRWWIVQTAFWRRAIIPDRNFKKWSEHAVFCTFWLENVLLATAACNFSRSQLQKVVRTCSERHILIESALLATTATSAPAALPSRPPKSLKNTAFRDFPNISRLWIFFLLTFAQLYLLSSDSTSLLCFFIFWLWCSALLFQLSISSEVRLLNFLRPFDYICSSSNLTCWGFGN